MSSIQIVAQLQMFEPFDEVWDIEHRTPGGMTDRPEFIFQISLGQLTRPNKLVHGY